MLFEPIQIEKQNEYLKLLKACGPMASDYSFINLWAWRHEYELDWSWSDDLVFIRQRKPEPLYWAPVGNWKNVKWERVFLNAVGESATFVRVPENLIHLWQSQLRNKIKITETREHWDYLYEVEALIHLKGNKYHKKKNLLNQFKKRYLYQFVPLKSDLIQRALDMQESWCTWRDCESSDTLSAENRAISNVLNNWEKLKNVSGGALLIDDQMVAYTVAEKYTDDMLLIHFEKGNPEIKGIYQAINQMYLTGESIYKFVNREQDLGDEGLRKAKLSYHPVDFIKKYNVIR
ncbi:DUF2156 domain-containing protein [Thermodesulfobacteriota bacterium]